MNYGKKYLALALALLMVFSILPVSAFAEEEEFVLEEIEEVLPVEEVVDEVVALEEEAPEEDTIVYRRNPRKGRKTKAMGKIIFSFQLIKLHFLPVYLKGTFVLRKGRNGKKSLLRL